jgi:hypothetical protein
MNSEPNENHGYESSFTSHNCIDVYVDNPGDSTVRPLTGERLKRAKAEWEKILRWQGVRGGEIPPEGDVTQPK